MHKKAESTVHEVKRKVMRVTGNQEYEKVKVNMDVGRMKAADF